MQQLDTQLWVSGSCGCCKRCYKRPGTWNAAGILQAPVWLYFSIKHQSVNMQELESIHNLCSGALPLVVEGQEVFAQQMELRLQLTLQLVRRRIMRTVTATAMHLIPGKNRLECC